MNPRRKSLTPIQARVLRFIRSCINRGMPPTREEIANEFHWSSINAAVCHLVALERKGYIRIEPGRARAIAVLRTEDELLVSGTFIQRSKCWDCGAALFGVNVCPMCAQGIGRKAS